LTAIAQAARGDALSGDNGKDKTAPVVNMKVHAFPLEEVRLLDGPFKHAMDLDGEYLLSLDVDRLVHNFRVNAGIPSAAQPLGGWEAPDCELRGHFVGHYMSACAQMYAGTGDAAASAVTLLPFYKIYGDRHYEVYWDQFTPQQWQDQ
jgi:hypothetical protein